MTVYYATDFRRQKIYFKGSTPGEVTRKIHDAQESAFVNRSYWILSSTENEFEKIVENMSITGLPFHEVVRKKLR